MKNDYYSIGDLSAATGVSIAMLRYYEKVKLLDPAYINKKTGYRYYDVVNFWEVETISICRRLEIPVKKICEFKKNKSISDLLDYTHHLVIEATKKSRHYSILRDDLLFYENQWRQYLELEQHPGCSVFFKWLPERKAAYVALEELPTEIQNEMRTIQYFELHKQMQERLKYTREYHYSTRVQYGYSLKSSEFENGNISLDGEWAEIPSLALISDKQIITLPAGNYICCNAPIFKSDDWVNIMKNYLQDHGFKPQRVYLKSVGIYPYDYTDSLFEVAILTNE